MDKFTLGEILGTSNYEVRAAINNLTQRKVALKLIPYKTDAEVPLISQEVQKLISLRHPNIIEVYGADTDTVKKLVLIEMECADDGSLAKLLATGQKLSVAHAVRIVCAVLRALEYAHTNRVVHFDIKPANILLFKDGTVKLADFGAAKTLDSRSFTESAGGTDFYAAPEYYKADKKLGRQTDIWAVGVVLYELLAGKIPFPTFEELYLMRFTPLTKLLPQEPHAAALQKILDRVFVPYDKRLASATEFLAALEPLIQPAAPPVPKPTPVLPRRALIGTGVVGLLGVGVGIGKLLGGNGIPPTPTPQPTATPSPNPPRATPTPVPTPTPTPKPRLGLTVAEARALPPTHPAPRTLKEYKAQMVSIPGGTFEMESNNGFDDEKPVHRVTLSPFVMGRTPVTVAMWREFCTATGRKMPEVPSYAVWKGDWDSVLDHPIVNVKWTDCKAYADWASTQLGIAIELPTEAQWEYASRGGIEGKAYPWDDGMDDSKCWYTKTSADKGTAPVSRSNNVFVNGYGLVDMSGNVYQWCRDWYDSAYYKSAPDSDPTGPVSGTYRVLRGGSWYDDAVYLRCAVRIIINPTIAFSNRGFRLIHPGP